MENSIQPTITDAKGETIANLKINVSLRQMVIYGVKIKTGLITKLLSEIMAMLIQYNAVRLQNALIG